MRRQSEKIVLYVISILLLTPILAMTEVFVFSTKKENPEDALVEWIKETAIQLNTLDWQTIDLDALSFLDKGLEGKRIVYLGEPDHYIHEKYNFRLILIRYLFMKGWRYIGMEMGRSDGKRADRFLETGDPSWLEQMAVYGYKGDKRTDRDDSKKKSRKKNDPNFVRSIVNEEKWFFEQLHLLNKNLTLKQSRARCFGYDLDMYPGGGYRDAKNILEKHSGNLLVRTILDTLQLIKNETVEQELERLKKLLDLIIEKKNNLEKILGKKDVIELKETIHCLHDSMRHLRDNKARSALKDRIAALSEREKTMFRQMDDLLESLAPNEKIILMGHNLHLSKDYKTVRTWGIPMWPSIGSHVCQKLPEEVYAIWMLYDHGRHADVSRQVYENVWSNPGRIESLMVRAGQLFLLPLGSLDPRAAYLDKECGFGVNGDTGYGLLRKNADAVFFISEVTAIGEANR